MKIPALRAEGPINRTILMLHARKLLALLIVPISLGFAAGPSPEPVDIAPRVLKHRLPAVSAAARRAEAEVELWVEINAQGQVINAAVSRATDPSLAMPCLRAIRDWRYAPAYRDGAPVPTAFVQPIHFGADGTTTITIASAPPRVRRRVSPEVPAELAHLDAEVTVALSVDRTGTVTDVAIVRSDAADLNDLTVDAALQWTFKPAIREDMPVTSKVYVPFHYRPGSGAKELSAKAPRATTHR